MIDQMNIAVELKHPDEHEPIDLFFEAINLILPSSKISEHSRKIHRSNSVPNDLAGLSSPECRTDKVKLDPDTPNGIDFVNFFLSIKFFLSNKNSRSQSWKICAPKCSLVCPKAVAKSSSTKPI